MHKLLQRQVKRWVTQSVPTPDEWDRFLAAVDQAYDQADADRALVERSLDLSSRELTEINENLRQDMQNKDRMQKAAIQSEKLAAIGQMASGVAHEINNPLGIILGFSEAVLRRLPAGDALQPALKSIEREAARCKTLVQNLLTFSRVATSEKETMDLSKTVEGALTLVMAQARVKQIEVRRELASGLPLIQGNSNQIQQIIVNLANNAFDAMVEKER